MSFILHPATLQRRRTSHGKTSKLLSFNSYFNSVHTTRPSSRGAVSINLRSLCKRHCRSIPQGLQLVKHDVGSVAAGESLLGLRNSQKVWRPFECPFTPRPSEAWQSRKSARTNQHEEPAPFALATAAAAELQPALATSSARFDESRGITRRLLICSRMIRI